MDENLTFRIILHHYILKTLHTRIILDHRIYYYIAGLLKFKYGFSEECKGKRLDQIENP
mgnify:CR=1 FL=1